MPLFKLFKTMGLRDKRRAGFGITECIVAGSMLADAVGTTAATAIVGAGIGAAVGAAGSAVTGGNVLTGALTGGLTGGIGGVAGTAGEALGIGSTAGQVLGGAASGALSGAITGQNPLRAAVMGGGQAALMAGLNSLGSSGTLDEGITSPSSSSSSSTPSSSESSFKTTPAGTLDTSGLSNNSYSLNSSNPSLSSVVHVTPSTSTPSLVSQASDYLFGSGTPTTTGKVVSAQNALSTAVSTGTPQIYTDASGNTLGIVKADGTISPVSSSSAGTAPSTSANKGVLGNLWNKVTSNPITTGMTALQMYNMSQQATPKTTQEQTASTQPAGWNDPLTKYSMTTTKNPISNYYTYGYTPQPQQISNVLTPMRAGGRATGRTGVLSSNEPTFEDDGHVNMGTGTGGQEDKIPAMLSEDEYVIPADTVSHLGDGSPTKGAKTLDRLVSSVRAHKTSRGYKGLPPKAKSPEQYLPKGVLP